MNPTTGRGSWSPRWPRRTQTKSPSRMSVAKTVCCRRVSMSSKSTCASSRRTSPNARDRDGAKRPVGAVMELRPLGYDELYPDGNDGTAVSIDKATVAESLRSGVAARDASSGDRKQRLVERG